MVGGTEAIPSQVSKERKGKINNNNNKKQTNMLKWKK